MTTPALREIKLHAQQFEAFMSKARYTACIAGHQSGKTFVGALWASMKIQEFPQGTGCIAAPTYPILRQSTIRKFFELNPHLTPYYKEQKSIIELPTGGVVYIRSTDDPLALEGMTLDWCWGDEIGMWRMAAWNTMRARLSTTGGKFFGTTTPYNLGWLYEDWYLPAKEGKDKDLAVFTWASVDSPYFPKEFAEKEKLRLSPAEYSRRYLGQFSKMQGLVYDVPPGQIIDGDDPIQAFKMQQPEITIAGIDWGFRNPTAIWIGRYKDGVWYTVDEYYEVEKTTTEIIEKAKILQAKWGINRWYADYAEPDRIEECRRAGLYVQEGVKDLKGGISLIQQLIRERRFFVLRTCRNFIDESNTYHYPEVSDGKNYKDEPEKFNDHLMDACRYALTTYKPSGNMDIRQAARIQENRSKYKSFS